MLKNAVLPACLFFCMVLISCAKEATYDRAAQLQMDVDSINKFIVTNKIAAKDDGTGLFYQVLAQGKGSIKIDSLDTLSVTYTGRLLNGAIIDSETIPVNLVYSAMIQGWKKGLVKIQPGGQIRLIIPSVMAYTNKQVGLIPPNSSLDYLINLIKISKKPEEKKNTSK